MLTTRAVTPLLVALGLLGAQVAAADRAPADAAPAVGGAVKAGDRDRPLEGARVYAYEVATFALEQVLTDRQGRFRFEDLPAGLYKLVAHKDGFLPAVHLLMRRTPETRQYVELRLTEERRGDLQQAESYWDARSRVPADVLREMGGLDGALRRDFETAATAATMPSAFRATMAAHGGVESLGSGAGDAQLTTAQVGVQGDLGSVEVGLKGRYEQMAPRNGTGLGPGAGSVRSLAFQLDAPERSRLSLASASGQMDGVAGVDLERYQLNWSGPAGSEGRSSVTARFIDQSNFFRAGWVDPSTIPAASRTWDIEGSYLRDIGDSTTLRTGLSYRQIDGEAALGLAAADWTLDHEAVGLWGVAESRLRPRVLVEYGLFSTLRDGGMSLMPHGGVVVELGGDWQLRGAMARRVETEAGDPYGGFSTALFRDGDSCRRVGEVCYEVAFSRGSGDESIKLGAVHREIAETLRLYFSEDFFDRLESLFLVRGDELPEVQFQLVRRISPRVLAKLESNYADGGGGIFYATDDRTYQNAVRYLVTSLDTQLQTTATGIFIAFHHLEQQLEPLAGQTAVVDAPQLEIERLQLMLTQDLSLLMDVSSSWAVRFNMELSRGATPYQLQADDELHKKLTGGFTVSF